MSDADLRALERRWRETGQVEDEAAWLRARAQGGELSQERLELAAYLGHEGASIAASFGRCASEGPEAPIAALQAADVGTASERLALMRGRVRAQRDSETFLAGLGRFGLEARMRAAGAAVALLEDSFRYEATWLAYAAALDWLQCPTEAVAEDCARLAAEVNPRFNDSGWKQHAVRCLAAAPADESEGDLALEAIGYAATAGCDMANILSAIMADVVPWALGYGDSLVERIKAHEREARS